MTLPRVRPATPTVPGRPLTHGRAAPGSPAPPRRRPRRDGVGRDRRAVRGRGPCRHRPGDRAHVRGRRPPLRDRRGRRAARGALRGVHGQPRRRAGVAARRLAYPPSVLRTIDRSRPFHVLFGSCRSPAAVVVRRPDRLGRGRPRRVRPAHGDARSRGVAPGPVHARRPGLRRRAVGADPRVARRRATPTKPPFEQVANFEEYTHLYHEAWGTPDVRWLLSVVPSSMIFDDHDVLDDWNTSRAWRDEMQATSWWEERITGALARTGSTSTSATSRRPGSRPTRRTARSAPRPTARPSSALRPGRGQGGRRRPGRAVVVPA